MNELVRNIIKDKRLVTDSFGRELPNGIVEESSDPIAFWFEKAKKFLKERKEVSGL
jgi:hypothetical protein